MKRHYSHIELPKEYLYTDIHTSYRRHNSSPSECFKSIVDWHNETVNIWTNILATLYFATSGLFIYLKPDWILNVDLINRLTSVEISILSFSYFIASIGFFMSSLYHTFSTLPIDMATFFNQFDYAGIYFIGFSGSLIGIYFGFYEYPRLKLLFLILNVLSSVFGVFSCFNHEMTQNKHLRILNISIGTSFGILFSVVLGVVEGFNSELYKEFLYVVAWYFSILGTGAIIYSLRIPERFMKETFDVIGQSHNLWHLFAFFAVRSLFNGWLDFILLIKHLPF